MPRASATAKRYASFEPWFGIEQEYTFIQNERPLGWPEHGYPAPQGPYYCGVGGDKMPGREIVEAHTAACIKAGLAIEGTNAEVMMGQWEFQIGVLAPPAIGDQLWMARWLLFRIAEDFGVVRDASSRSRCSATGTAPGAHTNFSTKQMRAAGRLGRDHRGAARRSAPGCASTSPHYGVGIEERLTGAHETARFDKFSYGTSDRGASIRIPWGTATRRSRAGSRTVGRTRTWTPTS